MTQIQGEQTENSFAGHIQLNGDAAPEMEVIVALTDQYVILDHASGELGRWSKSAVRVAPVGRGWFSLDVEDESVAFRPRRPGAFAASTLDLVPDEEPKKKRGRRKAGKAKTVEPSPPKPSRREKRRRRREETAAQVAAREASSIIGDGLASLPAVPPVEDHPPEPGPSRPESFPERPSADPADRPQPELFSRKPVSPEPQVAASPWDDVPTPQVPGKQRRRKEQSTEISGAKTKTPRKKTAKPRPEKAAKPRREKTDGLSQAKPSRKRREPRTASVAPGVTEPAGPPKRSATSRAFTAFKYGAKGLMYRISDELRQTGIVPFDRLPAAPARLRPAQDHEHDFRVHRLPGGLSRNVCHECGLVSIGESSGDD